MSKFSNPTAYTGRGGTNSRSGRVRFATQAEADAGVATRLVVSPAILEEAVDALMEDGTTTTKGIVRLATVGETSAGVLDTVANTPAGLAAVAIAGANDWSTTVKGIGELATTPQTVAYTLDNLAITPATLGDAFAAPPAAGFGSGTPRPGAFTTLAAIGAIDFDAGGSFESGGVNDIDIGADANTDAINIGTGAADRVITVGNVTGATQIVLNAGTAGIELTSTGAGDITVTSSDAFFCDCSGVLELNSSAGVINIGNDDVDQAINIGSDGERDVLIGSQNGAASLTLDAGTGAINIGTTIAHTVTIGNNTGSTAIVVHIGTGNFVMDGVGATTYTIAASTTGGTIDLGGTAQTGTITLGDSSGINIVQIGSGEGATTVAIAGGATSAKVVTIADGAVANLVTIGTVSGAASMDLLCGTGNFTLEGATASTYEISSTGVNTGTCKFASGTGARTVEIAGGGTGQKTINIGAASSADVITIGSTDGASSLALAVGSGDFSLDGAAASDFIIGASLVGGVITVGGTAATGIMTFGDSSDTQVVEIAAGEGDATCNICSGASASKAVNICTGAIDAVVTIGNVTTSSQIVMNSGTGGIQMASTGVGDITINSDDTLLLDSDGVLEINSSAGAISIGNDAVSLTCNFSTGAAAMTTNLGSTNSTSTTTVQAGTGGIDFDAAGIMTATPATASFAGAAVTINSNLFAGTFSGLSTAAAAEQEFTFTNSLCSETSVIILSASNLGSNDAQMTVTRIKQASGSFVVTCVNEGAASLNGNVVISGWLFA